MISDAQQDNSKQVAQVETFIRQKPDLLIVAPNERAALTAVMGQADGGEDPGDLPGARYPAAELHRLRAQRQRGDRPHGGTVHRGSPHQEVRQAEGQHRCDARPSGRGRRDQSRPGRQGNFRQISGNQSGGRSGGRLDSGQSQGSHDRSAARAAQHRRGVWAQRPHGDRRLPRRQRNWDARRR